MPRARFDADGFRSLALALPGAVEGSHMGHADFRVAGIDAPAKRPPRVFASLVCLGGALEETHGMVKVTPEEQAALVSREPGVYSPAAGAWGRQGCTLILLASAKRGSVARAVERAWANVRGAGRGKRTTRARLKRR